MLNGSQTFLNRSMPVFITLLLPIQQPWQLSPTANKLMEDKNVFWIFQLPRVA
jgi:hypothetical protein